MADRAKHPGRPPRKKRGRPRDTRPPREDTPLGWARPGNPHFELLRSGATVISSGMPLQDQLARLLRLSVDGLRLVEARTRLRDRDTEASFVVAEEAGEEDALAAQSDHRTVTLPRTEGTMSDLTLEVVVSRRLSLEEQELLELMANQILSCLERDPGAWFELLERYLSD